MAKNIYTVEIFGEENDTLPQVIEANIVIQTKLHGSMLMMEDARFCTWNKIFIFPDAEKAQYFADHFEPSFDDYRQGMIKDDYIFHIINCKYPIPDRIYADQIRMHKDFMTIEEEIKLLQ